MRLSMISWIIKTKVCVIFRSRRLRQITPTRGFDNSWYHAKTEFNNCFIVHFSHNSSSETEAKRSAILFLRRTLQGLSSQADVEHKCNICSRYCIYHVKFTNYCKLIECSRPIRFFIVSLMYNNTSFTDIKFNCSLSKLLLTCTIITFIWTFLQLEVIKKTNNYLFIFLSAFIID